MSARNPRSSLFNPRSWFKKGSYNVWCTVCAGTVKRGDARMRWDNVLVCNKCWDPYHPQDGTSRTPESENKTPINPRPEPTDTFGEGSEGDL